MTDVQSAGLVPSPWAQCLPSGVTLCTHLGQDLGYSPGRAHSATVKTSRIVGTCILVSVVDAWCRRCRMRWVDPGWNGGASPTIILPPASHPRLSHGKERHSQLYMLDIIGHISFDIKGVYSQPHS